MWPLPTHPQHPVAVFLAEVGEVERRRLRRSAGRAARAARPGRSRWGWPSPARRRSIASNCRCDEPQGRGLGRHGRSADVFGWGLFEDAVDDAGAVEPGHDRDPPRHGRRGVAALFLHPPHVQLDLRPGGRQRVDPAFGAPAQVGPQIGLTLGTGQALEPGQVRRCSEPQRIEPSRTQNLNTRRSSHTRRRSPFPCRRTRPRSADVLLRAIVPMCVP